MKEKKKKKKKNRHERRKKKKKKNDVTKTTTLFPSKYAYTGRLLVLARRPGADISTGLAPTLAW